MVAFHPLLLPLLFVWCVSRPCQHNVLASIGGGAQRRRGVSTVGDGPAGPYLTNLNPDPLLSECLVRQRAEARMHVP